MNNCRKPSININNLRVAAGGATILSVGEATLQGPGVVQLLGPNGAGKTTLLRAIAGLVPTTGSVEVCGVEVTGNPEAAGRFVAYMPQDAPSKTSSFPVTPRELLNAALRLRGEEGNAEPILEAVGLDKEYWDTPLNGLSGGSRQKVFLARTLLLRRPVILLDEPFSALDPQSRLRAAEVVAREAERALAVVSSHDPELLMDYTRLIVLLSGGRIVEVGAPSEVMRLEVLERVYGGLVVELGGHLHIREGH